MKSKPTSSLLKYFFVALIIGIVSIGAVSCTNHTINETSRKYVWKYQTGYYIGDVVPFDSGSGYTIDKNNTIRKKGVLVGTVIKVNEEKMEICSTNGKEGTYVVLVLSKEKLKP